MKVLLSFADADYLVSPDLADRVKRVIPSNRFDSTIVASQPEPAKQPDQRGTHRSPAPLVSASVFERHQPNKLTPPQQSLANRLAKRLTPPPKSSKK